MMGRDPYRSYRRRMRRSLRRDGFPVMFLPLGEPLGLIAAAAFGRWAYRHRSAFLPFGIATAAFILAAIVHAHHAGLWVLAAVVTLVTAPVLGMPHRIMWARPAGRITAGILARAWEACGIDRPAERAYATAVATVTGGWLSAAIGIGPAAKPLPALAVIATLILGIPWWAHRRRRARVRALRTIQAWPSLAENMGLPGSRIASVVTDAWGWTARVILRKGTTAAQAIEKLPAIESGLGLRPGSARAIPDAARADRFTLRVIETNPHAKPIPWPGVQSASITRPVDIGLFEDGRPVAVTILRRNVLVGGITDAGKSGVVNIFLAALVACTDAVVWGVDLKGGMELQPWARCLGRLATTPAQATALFADAITELDRRAAEMAAAGRRVWEPSPETPALIIVVDEYAELPAEAQEYADSLARRGRAVAVTMLAATQRPTQEAMGKNAVRAQMDVRICLRVRERRDVDLILGQGSFSSGWHAHMLTQPGEFLVSAREHTTPERARAYLITDDQVSAHAVRYARSGPAAGPETTAASPESPQTRRDSVPDAADSAGPDAALWAALSDAGPGGVSVAELLALTGMTRPTLYRRLRAHARAGRVVRTIRGSWRASGAPSGRGDGRPPPRPAAPRHPPGGPGRPRRRDWQ
jgi:DNA segregation ATPase FtsK/SpoIIIE, S-DNA-T family